MKHIQILACFVLSQTVAMAQGSEHLTHSSFLTNQSIKVTKTLKQQKMNRWHIPAANYSGITRLNGNNYAVCDDKSRCDGFTLLNIEQDPKTGKIIDIKQSIPAAYERRMKQGVGQYRDCEGIAYCKERNTLFVSGEEDQRIKEYTLDGEPTGQELNIPECFATTNRRTNYGFEALTYNEHTRRFWTTTESTLKQDGESASLTSKDVQNILRLQSFDTNLQPLEQVRYVMDKPTVKKSAGTYIHGVPSLLALDDGNLIVMEREEYVPANYIGAFCRIKVYIFDVQTQQKRLLTEFTTHLRPGRMNLANYEGMCLGRTLDDGRPTLLLICDSQGGQGNKLFHLKDYMKVIICE